MWIHGTSLQALHHQFPNEKKVLRCIKQMFSNVLHTKSIKIYSRCQRKRSEGFGASQDSQGGNLPRPQKHELSAHVVAFVCFSHMLDTDACHLPRLISVMLSLTSIAEARAWLNESTGQLSGPQVKWTQTYDMMVRMFLQPSLGPRCGARAFRPSSPKLFKLRSTSVTLLLTRRASARACRVGTAHMAK